MKYFCFSVIRNTCMNKFHNRETHSPSFSTRSISSGDNFFTGFLSFSRRYSKPRASDTSSELHPVLRSNSDNLPTFKRSTSRTVWLSKTTTSLSKKPDADTWIISSISDSSHPPPLKTEPIRFTYWFTHFGVSFLGRSGDVEWDDHDDEVEPEFLRQRSTAASLQNSTHLEVLDPITRPESKLLVEKFVDDPEDICLVRVLWLRKADSRWKNSDRSDPQQNIRVSSTKKTGLPAKDGLQGM